MLLRAFWDYDLHDKLYLLSSCWKTRLASRFSAGRVVSLNGHETDLQEGVTAHPLLFGALLCLSYHACASKVANDSQVEGVSQSGSQNHPVFDFKPFFSVKQVSHLSQICASPQRSLTSESVTSVPQTCDTGSNILTQLLYCLGEPHAKFHCVWRVVSLTRWMWGIATKPHAIHFSLFNKKK